MSSSSVAPAPELLSLAKAADRARCHHRTGCGGAQAARRPSRRLLDDRAADGESSTAEPRPAIPLLDAYEIEWIRRELDRLIVGSRQEKRSETAAASAAEERRRAVRAKAAGGFWVRHAVAVCSPKGGVAEPVASTSGAGGRQ